MRPWPAVLAAAVALLPALAVLAPSVASAGPAAELCTADDSRGGVPATFVLDACAAATSLTVRNDIDVPVLIRADGDVGVPSPVHERGSATASVLRLAAGPGTVLMPGDVVRWPLGAGAGGLTVSELQPGAVPAIVREFEAFLPALGSKDVGVEDYRAFAVVAREVSTAVEARRTCVRGKNFLQVTACDVLAASAISRAAVAQLPNGPALQVLSVTLDRTHWSTWSAPRVGDLATRTAGALRLAQVPTPVPVDPVPPPPAAAPPAAAPPAAASPAAALPAAPASFLPAAAPAPAPPLAPASAPPPAPPPSTGPGPGPIAGAPGTPGRPGADDEDDDEDDRGTSNGHGKGKGKNKDKGKDKDR
jgi:hypothetical protein